jgi:hypothetical protein
MGKKSACLMRMLLPTSPTARSLIFLIFAYTENSVQMILLQDAGKNKPQSFDEGPDYYYYYYYYYCYQ